MRIKVEVDERPPKKDGANSLWKTDEAEYVKRLREKINEEKKNMGITGSIKGSVKIKLIVYAPNIMNEAGCGRYVGDLDTFVAGVCDSIQPAGRGAHINPILEECDEIGPKIPLVIADDSQIVYIISQKIKHDKVKYCLTVEAVDQK